jgi:hypothetical protein
MDRQLPKDKITPIQFGFGNVEKTDRYLTGRNDEIIALDRQMIGLEIGKIGDGRKGSKIKTVMCWPDRVKVDDRIVAGSGVEDEDVLAGSTGKPIRTKPAMEIVAVCSTIQLIATDTAIERIVASATKQFIGAIASR